MTSYLWSNFNPKPSCFPKHAASRHFFSINTNPERSSPHETPETTPRRNGLDEFDAEIKEDTLPQGFSERVGMIWLCASIKQRQTRVNSTNIFRYFSVPATWQAVWENEKKKWDKSETFKFPLIDSIRQPHGNEFPYPDAAPMHGFFLKPTNLPSI